MENIIIADTLFLRRHKMRMSTAALAEKSGVNRNTIRAMEKGLIDKMQLSTIQAVAGCLGYRADVVLVEQQPAAPDEVRQ